VRLNLLSAKTLLRLKTWRPPIWSTITAAETTTPAAATIVSLNLELESRVANHRIPKTQMSEKAADSRALIGLALHSAESDCRTGRARRTATSLPLG
jgi:hypothetical protein